MMFSKLINFRIRKFVHYSLIVCILLIQIALAIFIYNELSNRKNIAFIENQLKEIHALENLTSKSRKELLNSHDYFQKYMMSEDEKYLDSYFQSVNRLAHNLDSINNYHFKNPELNNILTFKKKDSSEYKKFKTLIDSTHLIITKPHQDIKLKLPKIQKYQLDFDTEKYEIQTHTYKDTIQKKGLFGRLKDAIAGKENIRKDSTVVTLKQNRPSDISKIKTDLDSIINNIDKYYTTEIHKVQVNIKDSQTQNLKSKSNNEKFYKASIGLMFYTSNLMSIYEFGIKDAKSNLQQELNNHNSDHYKIRMYLAFGSMILMFIVSILIMYFTRIAFIYEQKLKSANRQIKENLNFKNRILGMLSHELRSPLKIIGIFISRINKRTEDTTVKDYLKSISFTNNTLLMQANQILEYTKNQQVENKLIPVTFNLQHEIESILKSIKPYIETRNNQLIISETIDPTIVVFSDNTKINQIFINILGNANKFTENGKITVTTYTEPIHENTITLVTKISDTGAGISESDLEKIFEPYYQGIISEEVENLGAGLGLSLCKEIIELYSGNITVTSQLTKGTTVTFSINLNLKNESLG